MPEGGVPIALSYPVTSPLGATDATVRQSAVASPLSLLRTAGPARAIFAGPMPTPTNPAMTTPDRPEGVTGVPGDGQVSLAWRSPAWNGNAPIGDYIVQVSSNDGATWTRFDDGVSDARSATVTGLTNGTNYVFRVAAVNRVGTGAVSAASAAIAPLAPTPPNMPTGVTISSSSDYSIILAWNDVSGESGYLIERSSDYSEWAGSEYATWTGVGLGAANTTTFVDTGAQEAARYTYRVIGVNHAGQSAPSAVVTVETRLRAPEGVLASVVNGGRIDLNWVDRSSRETHYMVEQFDPLTNAWAPAAYPSADSSSVTVTGSFAPSTTYQFRVRAVAWSWWWGYTTAVSDDVMASVTTSAYPSMPTGVVAASSSDSAVRLEWNDVSGESGYRIERNSYSFEWMGSDYATWEEVGRGAADITSFTDTGLEEGSHYNYRVIAINAVGASAPGAVVIAQTRLRAPEDVVATVVNGGRIDLKWTDRSSRETHYVVEQFDQSTNAWAPVGGTPFGSSVMTVTGSFAPNTSYQFRVRAVSGWWDYVYASSDDAAASVTAPAYPSPPGRLTATAFSDSVHLSWEFRPDVSVVVERMTGGGEWTTVTEITSASSSYEDDALETSTAYSYRIAFRNAHGTSAFSEAVSVVTAVGPSVAVAYRSASAVFVGWTCPLEGVTAVTIERGTSGSDAWTVIAALAGTATGYTDTAVVLGTSYRYRILFERGARPRFTATSEETGPEPKDFDGDQLTDGEELATGTNPRAFSTDSDLLGDGFERTNGLDPLNADEDGNGVSDQYDDFDGDGLANWQEAAFGTNTRWADADGDGRPDGFDSDGDGVSDGTEATQGSDPTSPLDLGEASSADARIKLRLSVGDPSGSHSEQWALCVGSIRQASPTYGEVGEGEYFFDVGKSYPISIEHQGSRYDEPDYDWYANIDPTDRPEFFVVDDNTPLYIVGAYQGDWMDWAGAGYASLKATLHVPRFDTDVDSRNDSGHAIPDDNSAEDRLENDGSTGKLVFATTGDVDQDGIVDSVDFGGIDGVSFVPMAVRLSENVKEARPTSIQVFFDYDPAVFRVWKPGCDAGATRTTSDIIPAQTWVSADEIGLVPGGDQTVYVEALQGVPSVAVPLITSVRVEGERWSGTLMDTVHLLPVALDLDVDSNNDGRIAEDDDLIEEQSPGCILFINSDDDNRNGVADVFDIGRIAGENDLAEIVLVASPSIFSFGSLIVTYDETIVRLYTRPDRSGGVVSGSPIAPESTLYAEGRMAGTSLVTVTFETSTVRVTDAIRLTVQPYPATIDVDVDSDNNDAFGQSGRSAWEETLEDHAYAIGKLIMLDNPQRTVTPIVLQMPAGLPANAGSVRVRIDWAGDGAAGSVRLWNRAVIDDARNPASVDQGGDRIVPGGVYKLSDLRYDATDGRIVIYAEGVKENKALKTLAGVEAAPKVDERIRGTLVVNGDDSAFDEVKYLVANEDSFYYALHTRQEVRNALASRGVYSFADMPKFGLQPKSPLDLLRLGVPDDANLLLGDGSGVAGFKAMVYQDYITGDRQYVLAFGGTDGLRDSSDDWYNNFIQGFGYGAPEQYVAAMRVIDALAKNPATRGRVLATGHSLGGGLASAAAVVGGIRAETFNAAWLREETLQEPDGMGGFRERYPGSLARFAGAVGFIDAYYVDWDILTFVQMRASNIMGISPVGSQHELDGPYDASGENFVMIKLHEMKCILYGMLVTESSFGRIAIDMLGYDAYFGH